METLIGLEPERKDPEIGSRYLMKRIELHPPVESVQCSSSSSSAFFDSVLCTSCRSLQNGGMTGASIVQLGSFVGFSIEMSMANQACEYSQLHKVLPFTTSFSSYIQVPFLNLMANLQQCAGRVYIWVGGNTQETAVHVDSLPDGEMIQKDNMNTTNPMI